MTWFPRNSIPPAEGKLRAVALTNFEMAIVLLHNSENVFYTDDYNNSLDPARTALQPAVKILDRVNFVNVATDGIWAIGTLNTGYLSWDLQYIAVRVP